MNIVLIGRSGQVAWELQHLLGSLGRLVILGRPEIDLANPDSVRRALGGLKPAVLVNAAAYTAVDQAEAEPAAAMAINADAPPVLAEEARRLGAMFVTYSTDYVFDGEKASPYTELDGPSPLSVYGASKLAGERAVEAVSGSYLILRTSWVYGARGKNFVRTIVKLATEREELRVVEDQIGAPTWSRDIARGTAEMIRQVLADGGPKALGERRGIYNMTAQGSVSWYEFAATIVREMDHRRMAESRLARVTPIATAQYPTPAVRPKNSRLSNDKIYRVFGLMLPDWKASLLAVMDEMAIGTPLPAN